MFLWIGLLAGIAVRSITFFDRFNPGAVIWVWRYAMISYTVFFGYRYLITRKRRRIVSEMQLESKISELEGMDAEDKKATLYVLRSIMRSKELINYSFICILSLVALALDFALG